MLMFKPKAWLSTTGAPSLLWFPCTQTFNCGSLKVWCVDTRTLAASDCSAGNKPSARKMSVVILKAVLAEGTPQ